MLNLSKNMIAVWVKRVVFSSVILMTAGCNDVVISSPKASDAPVAETHVLVDIPETDCEIRVWYNYQVVAIPVINARWVEMEMSAKERALRAYKLRHNARINARFMMDSPIEATALQARDMLKYGNAEGPTFEYLVEKNIKAGLTQQQAYEKIIKSSARTDNDYNEDCE